MAAGEINDGQPLKTEAEPRLAMVAFIVRAPVPHGARHDLKKVSWRDNTVRIDDTADPTHGG